MVGARRCQQEDGGERIGDRETEGFTRGQQNAINTEELV
jgi:hypothetical protein